MKKLTYENIYEEITRRIKNGYWKKGDKIPTVQALAKEFNVGTSSIREAIRILGKQNILAIEQGRGTFVINDLKDNNSGSFDFLEDATMLQLTEARSIIEPELAALAAVKATEDEIRAINHAAKGMSEKLTRGQSFFEEDLAFHQLITKAAKNDVIFHMLQMVRDLLINSRGRTTKMRGMDIKASHYHLLIADAITQRNPSQARVLMKAHLEDVIFVLRGKQQDLEEEDE